MDGWPSPNWQRICSSGTRDRGPQSLWVSFCIPEVGGWAYSEVGGPLTYPLSHLPAYPPTTALVTYIACFFGVNQVFSNIRTDGPTELVIVVQNATKHEIS